MNREVKEEMCSRRNSLCRGPEAAKSRECSGNVKMKYSNEADPPDRGLSRQAWDRPVPAWLKKWVNSAVRGLR